MTRNYFYPNGNPPDQRLLFMTLAEIKTLLPLVEVLSRYGLKPSASGRMKCPFHRPDHKPSFQVFFDTDKFCCFSDNCDAGGGDIYDFIEKMDNSSKAKAIGKAKAWAMTMPGAPASANGQLAKSVVVPLVDEVDPETRRFVLGQMFERFRASLARSQKAQAYLRRRGLDGEHLEAGYNSGAWVRNETEVMLRQAEALGLALPGEKGYKAFARNCIVLPLKDANGEIVSLYGRSLSNGSARHFYLRGRQGLYPGYPDPATTCLILTESAIDAASLRRVELPKGTSVLSLYGTNGWTREHEAALGELEQLEEVVLFFDGDAAGRTALGKRAGQVHTLRPGVAITEVETPDSEDVNSLLTGHGPEHLHELIEARRLISSLEAPSEQAEEPSYRLETGDAEALRFAWQDITVVVLGGVKLHDLSRLKVTLKLEAGGVLHMPLDLYQPLERRKFIDQAAERFSLSRDRLRLLVDDLIAVLEAYRFRRRSERQGVDAPYRMSPPECDQARTYLSDPDLMNRTSRDIGRSGVVGEEINRMLLYLALTSRKREKPLHVLCLAKTGMGKTYLQESVGRLIPPEDLVEATCFSENALYYFGQRALKHKALLIEDLDGAEDVLYPLRELQSKGRLSKSVPIKDDQGRIETRQMLVEGPVAVSVCTTNEAVLDDNQSRSLLLHLDSSREQSEAILQYQRQVSAGLIDQAEQERVRGLLQNVQRLLKPVRVVNPYAEHLVLPPLVFQQRRANQLYLSLIETITFYHQYQRRVRTKAGVRYIETTIEDIEAANALMLPVLTTKSDEITGACRLFLTQLAQWLLENERESFYQGEVRQGLRLSPSRLKRYLRQLQDYGYVEVLGGSRYRRGLEYGLTKLGRQGSLQEQIRVFLSSIVARLGSGSKGSKS